MANPDLDRLAAARHVLLTSFRADGTEVPTCVWISREGDVLYVLTHAGSGKVKRIRRNPRILLAPSDGRGRPQGGASAATAVVADDEASTKRASALIRRRYGIQYPLLRSLMGLRGRRTGRPVAIRITDPQPVSAPAAAESNS
jgi:hypothetical protein